MKTRNILLHERIQFATGQGAFHGGTIFFPNDLHEPIRWIYDIGSRSLGGQNKLASALDRFMGPRIFPATSNNKTVDTVFISHFDQDHVNGIPLLKKKGISVKEFVIPALNHQERIIS